LAKYVPKAARLVHRTLKPVRRLGRIQVIAQGKSKIDFEPSRNPFELPVAEEPEVVADAGVEENAEEIPVESSEEDNEVSVEEDDTPVITLYTSDKKARKPIMRPGSYFSISFGKAQDGSIAIANSFSTGNKGRSDSRSTSYGAPRN
jgi:hypothetical protein